MTRFLLVHGSWHGAWCWERLVARLDADGHEASAIDLPAHGGDRTPPWSVALEDDGARVIEAARERTEPPHRRRSQHGGRRGHRGGGAGAGGLPRDLPRAYVACSQDRAVSIERQRAMAERAGIDRIVTLDTDHSPFLSAPDDLAERLAELSRDG